MVKPWKTIPICDLYMNKDKTLFLLGSCAIESTYGMTVTYGNLKHILQEDMKSRGLDIVLKDLEEFPRREKKQDEKSELQKMTPAEEKKFHKDHRYILLQQNNKNTLEMTPMKPVKKGFSGNKETVVSLPCTNADFFESLMQAFEDY